MTLPFLDRAEVILFFFYVLCRFSGLFLVSPVLSNKLMGKQVKTGIVVFSTLILGSSLYPQYFGPSASHLLPELRGEEVSILRIAVIGAAELFVGYLIGFLFHLLFEMLILAGQQVGMLVGFSMAEMLDPVSGTSQGLISQLYGIAGTLIVLSLDLHHQFIETLVRSYDLLPIGEYILPPEGAKGVIAGGTRMFGYCVRLAAIPYLVLMLSTLGLGYMTRVMPEMNIFMVGFPVKLLLGFFVVVASLSVFKEIIQEFLVEMINLVGQLLPQMVPPV